MSPIDRSMEKFENIEVIGFDLDQTLYPKSPAVDAAIQSYLFLKIAQRRGVSVGEAQKLFSDLYKEGRGLSGSQSMETLGFPNSRDIVQEALEHADIAATLDPSPETASFLAELAGRYTLDLVTGSNTSETRKKLAAIGIDPNQFKHLITADTANKSTGEAYQVWLSLYPDLEPEQFLYIGDRALDHTVPSPLGIRTLLVNINKLDAELPCIQLSSLLEARALLV